MLLELLVEFLLQVIAEAAWEALLHSLLEGVRAAGRRTSWPRTTAALASFGRGAVAGGLSVWLLPHPLLGVRSPTGLSLLIAPLATGLTMWGIGRSRARRGRQPEGLMTFWLAFDFAFAMAAVRFFLLNPHAFR